MQKSNARPRVRPALLLAMALALVAAVVAAQPALAYPAYNHSTAVCASCHVGHEPVAPEMCTAAGCHAGFKVPAGQVNCWACHDPGQDMSTVGPGAPATCQGACHLASDPTATVAGTPHDPHPDRVACTQSGCHAVSTAVSANGSPHHVVKTVTPVTTELTAKVIPATVALGKRVKVTGAAAPVAALAGAKVIFKLERKVGTRWVRMKAPASATVNPAGSYTWTYKTVKKGAHRVTLTIKATTTFTRKSLSRTFKVK